MVVGCGDFALRLLHALMKRTSCFPVLAISLLFAASLNAATITVTTAVDELDFPSGPSLSLREALRDAIAAVGDDTVVFSPSLSGQTLVLTSQISINMNTVGNVIVDAGSLPGGLTLSGSGACRLFLVTGSGGAVSLVGLVLTSGNGVGGGVNGIGGAIYNLNGTLNFDRCTFINHATNIGGAVMNNGGTLTVQRSTFAANSANDSGGAINHAGIGSLTVERCTFSGNSASNNGGALYNAGAANLTQCTFTSNSSLSGGAIFSQMSSSLALTHCTVTNNSAENSGGGIRLNYAALTLTNSIVAGNSSPSGLGLDIGNSGGSPFGASTVTRVGANLVQSLLNSGNLASDSGPAAISEAPLLSPLGLFGGLTQTVALLPGSPARNAAIGSSSSSDQRGFPILGTADIGAYEAGTITNFENFIWETLPVTATLPQHATTFDYDGDGHTNEAEWIALTDPISATSRFEATSERQAANLEMTVPTASGRLYTLHESATLAGDSWTAVSGSVPQSGNGSPITFQIPISSDSRFYRVQVSLP